MWPIDRRNPGHLPLSHLTFTDLRSQHSVFTDMAAFTFDQVIDPLVALRTD